MHPSALYLLCPHCDEETLHRVVRGRSGNKRKLTLEGTVKCSECGLVHHTTVRESKPLEIPVFISWMDETERKVVEIPAEDTLSVDSEMYVDDIRVLITSLESEGKRVSTSIAAHTDAIWAKRFDRCKVKVSLNRGRTTHSYEILAEPDEEFYIGDILELGRTNGIIHRIKTKERLLRDGCAQAKDIVRIYSNPVRKTYA